MDIEIPNAVKAWLMEHGTALVDHGENNDCTIYYCLLPYWVSWEPGSSIAKFHNKACLPERLSNYLQKRRNHVNEIPEELKATPLTPDESYEL